MFPSYNKVNIIVSAVIMSAKTILFSVFCQSKHLISLSKRLLLNKIKIASFGMFFAFPYMSEKAVTTC